MICEIEQLPDPPLPLLITGVAGVAGYAALHYFRARYPGQVIGMRPVRNWRLKGDGVVGCDVENQAMLQQLFDRHQFASVLDCAGSCALKACELDPAMAWRINVQGVRELLKVMQGSSTRLVHLSIDLVYSGVGSGRHVETDATDPVSVFGKTMSIAESLVQLARPEACQVRISLPMGISFNGHAGAIDWIQSRYKQQKPATLYFDEVRTPTYTDCLNRVLQIMLANRESGLFHAGGPRALSLYQIAQIVNRVGGYDPRNVMGCLRSEAGPIPPRAGDVSMDSTRLEQMLGFAPVDPWPFHSKFVPTHPEWHWDRSESIKGSPELLREVLYKNPRLSTAHAKG